MDCAAPGRRWSHQLDKLANITLILIIVQAGKLAYRSPSVYMYKLAIVLGLGSNYGPQTQNRMEKGMSEKGGLRGVLYI